MNLYVKKDIDLGVLCLGWEDLGYCYRLMDGMGEIIEVYKHDGAIVNYGYNGLITDWYMHGMLSNHKEEKIKG